MCSRKCSNAQSVGLGNYLEKEAIYMQFRTKEEGLEQERCIPTSGQRNREILLSALRCGPAEQRTFITPLFAFAHIGKRLVVFASSTAAAAAVQGKPSVLRLSFAIAACYAHPARFPPAQAVSGRHAQQ